MKKFDLELDKTLDSSANGDMPQKKKSTSSSSAFKNWIDASLLKRMADEIHQVYPNFNTKSFLKTAAMLEPLELKSRVQLVRSALHQHLPPDYETALSILLESLQRDKLSGFDLWPYTDFVQTYGLEHFDVSMLALRTLTQRFTSEFAVRPFLIRYPGRTLKLLSKWSQDPNPHVRRWTSEGTRPRLPWGERLDHFIKNPSANLKLLERLRFDPEIYVRKSVANHLNDIAKDHPDLVVKVLKEWLKECPPAHRDSLLWIRRHGLRTLIKNGHNGALELMGVPRNTEAKVQRLSLDKKSLKMGDSLRLSFQIVSSAKRQQKLIVDYVIHHMKANGQRSPKVFKLKTLNLEKGEIIEVVKTHRLKKISTRRYYSGVHLLEIQVNGKVLARTEWHLQV